MDLADAALRAGGPTHRPSGPGPLVGPGPDPLLGGQRPEPLAHRRVAGPARPGGQRRRVVHAGAADPVDAPRPGPRDHLALRRQRRVGDPPAVPDRPDPLPVGDPSRIEEHLVEVHLAGEVPQRADVDADLVQVDQEVGDAAPLRHVGVGAGQQHRVVRPVRPRRPHLLAGDAPLVAVAHRPGRQRGEVRARARLAEQLAPALLVRHDRREEAAPLLVGAVGEQGWRAQVQPERVQPAEVVRGEDGLDRPGGRDPDPEAAVLRRPGRDDQPRRPERRVPRLVLVAAAHGPDRVRPAAPGGRSPRLGDVVVDPGLHRVEGVARRGVGPDGHPAGHRPSKRGSRPSRQRGEALAEVGAARGQLEREGLVGEVALEVEGRAGVQEPLGEAEGDRRPVGESSRRAPSAAAATSSGATAVWTSPHAAASVPDSSRPSSKISLARVTPTRRGISQVPPLSGVNPRAVNGSQKRASSAATQKSAATARCNPIPATRPRAAATTGTCTAQRVATRRWAWAGSRRWMLPARGRLAAALAGGEVETGAEVRAGAGQHDGPHRLVGVRGLQLGDQRAGQVVVEGVASPGPVEGEAQHRAVVLDAEPAVGRHDRSAKRSAQRHQGAWRSVARPGGSGSRTGPWSRLGRRIVARPGSSTSPR